MSMIDKAKRTHRRVGVELFHGEGTALLVVRGMDRAFDLGFSHFAVPDLNDPEARWNLFEVVRATPGGRGIYHQPRREFISKFPNAAAAEMWVLHRG